MVQSFLEYPDRVASDYKGSSCLVLMPESQNYHLPKDEINYAGKTFVTKVSHFIGRELMTMDMVLCMKGSLTIITRAFIFMDGNTVEV